MGASIQYFLSGLSIGGVYALLALGFSMMWSVARAANFNHGDIFMVGGMGTVVFLGLGLPVWVSAVLAILIATIAGALIERFLIRPFNREPNSVGWMLTTVAIGVMIVGASTALLGSAARPLPSPLMDEPLRIGGAGIFPQELLLPAVAVLTTLALYLFQSRTHLGRAIRAVAANRTAAELMGIDADRVTLYVFAVAGGLGALAGFLVAPVIQASTTIGLAFGLKAFMVAIIAGITNPAGVVIVALVFGVVERFIEGYFSTSARDAVGFSIMILVLLAFPQGIFARKEVAKV
ncbi:MAG: branched-chain amino acid ABC transporter permease [Methylocystis sp.]|nr:branched-chain amino acid ABC transporter permease [Methylocystis sp.]MCA3588859.1 branched-chain amino acid ABC transporter permease [Methylocystis sp.]MCA3590844.1 branched-chain amino acid ABC transporter permease [Methylocystis sp.]